MWKSRGSIQHHICSVSPGHPVGAAGSLVASRSDGAFPSTSTPGKQSGGELPLIVVTSPNHSENSPKFRFHLGHENLALLNSPSLSFHIRSPSDPSAWKTLMISWRSATSLQVTALEPGDWTETSPTGQFDLKFCGAGHARNTTQSRTRFILGLWTNPTQGSTDSPGQKLISLILSWHTELPRRGG